MTTGSPPASSRTLRAAVFLLPSQRLSPLFLRPRQHSHRLCFVIPPGLSSATEGKGTRGKMGFPDRAALLPRTSVVPFDNSRAICRFQCAPMRAFSCLAFHRRICHLLDTHTLSLSLSRRRDRFAARWHAGGEKYCVARACASGKFSKRNDAYEREQTSSAFANFKSHRVHRCTIRRNKDLRCRREDHAALRTKVEQLRVFRSD